MATGVEFSVLFELQISFYVGSMDCILSLEASGFFLIGV